jgi:hypothetical protein
VGGQIRLEEQGLLAVVDTGDRRLERVDGPVGLACPGQRVPEQAGGGGQPARLLDQVDRSREMCHGDRGGDPQLGATELEQRVRLFLWRGRLGQRPP